ncbi:multidrug resistance protein B [Rickettsia rhipicephali str. 3-7-female6-CWPP]|uniref:Multidrug resistance protein B n=1 Tax=Rickettsia rhipicephali (strain 3-7-female6-CWPP) TaxID=1105113 RepID=A0AAI8F706_RICR3|nr:multidrug resistance protein B [Rickettsia rhipicephali str. 3-7-female6-CWPP]
MSNDNLQPLALSKKQLFAFFGMVVCMFMSVLDIQIVASSLSVIAAGLAALQTMNFLGFKHRT